LSASGLIGAYTLCLMLRPSLCPWAALRYAVILFCLASLTVFGGRTALLMVLAAIAVLALRDIFRLVLGARLSLSLIIVSICALSVVFAGVLTAIELGVVDKMILRFSSDNGSAWSRLAALHLLGSFDWRELILGPDPSHASSLQTIAGLQLGVENFWIACVVQYGIVHTVLLTIGLACFFAEILKRSHPAARVLLLFIIIVAASSVSFSSKNTNLAEFVMLIVVLLPRERTPLRQARPPSRQRAGAMRG
jgi:hypothetical protein